MLTELSLARFRSLQNNNVKDRDAVTLDLKSIQDLKAEALSDKIDLVNSQLFNQQIQQQHISIQSLLS